MSESAPYKAPQNRRTPSPYKLYADGLCEPNPNGIATFGFVIENPTGRELHRGKGLAARGREEGATNNVAEYTAVLRAVERLLEFRNGGDTTDLVIHSDSQLLVHQLAGTYRVRSARIRPLFNAARNLLNQFFTAEAIWVPREQNEVADALSVEAYVEVMESDRRPRSASVNLEALGKLLFRANGAYLVDLLLGTCECPDWRRINSSRFHIRCKHLLKAQSVLAGVAVATKPPGEVLASGDPTVDLTGDSGRA